MGGRPAVFDGLLQGGVLFLVVATPLALGTVHVPTVAILQWAVLTLFLVWVLKTVWVAPAYTEAPAGPSDDAGSRLSLFGHPVVSTGLGIPIALFLLLVVAQLVPLPPGVIRVLSPGAARLYESSLPGWGSGSGVDFARAGSFLLGPGHDAVVRHILETPADLPVDPVTTGADWRTLSIYPFATQSRLLVLLTLVAMFVIVVQGFRSRRRIETALRAIVLFGFALAIFGIVQKLSWNGRIYWSIVPDIGSSPFGPFINHNHFAAFLAMIVPVATGMLMDEGRRLWPGREGGGPGEGRRPGIYASQGSEPFARLLLAAFVVGVMAAAVVFSASRGASLALAGAFLLYGGALASQGRIRRPEAVLAAVLLAVALGLSLWLGIGPLKQKLEAIGDVETEPSLLSRLIGWRWTMKIVSHFPLLGTGFGTFAQSWAHYYPPGTASIWHEAHNDYLQLLSETGAAGAVVFAVAIGIFAWRYLLPGILRGRRREGYTMHGLVVGLVAVALHSIVDFPLQINGCAVLFVVLAGLLVAWRKRMEAVA